MVRARALGYGLAEGAFMRSFRAAFAALLSFASFFDATGAHADCAAPRDYVAKVNGNQVTVCPTYAAGDGTCPQAGGMLRVGLSDAGSTVEKLADSCQAPAPGLGTDATSCYVDDCVPPGTYQYGYATPLDCAQACGGQYAVEVSVTTALSGCTSDAGAPTIAGSAPWNPAAAVAGSVPNTACVYRNDSGTPVVDDGGVADAASDSGVADAASDSGVVDAVDASRQVDGGPSESADDAGTTSDAGRPPLEGPAGASGGGGCAVVAAGSTEHTVLAIDAFALACGIVVLGRRRARRAT
jgi:hypothetical protein